MQFITIRIPLIDTGEIVDAKINKMHEELHELSREFSKHNIDKPAAISEVFDVVQVALGYIHALGKEILVGDDLPLFTEEFFRKCNEDHIEKMRLYAAERGWRI